MSTKFIINNIYHPPYPDYDPLNLPRTVSKNRFGYEIHPDALEIIERLNQAQREGTVREIIWEYFGKYFGEDIMGDDWETYRGSILDLWRYYCR